MSKYHKILGIPSSASQQEIKRAYRKMVKRYHPDLNSSSEAEEMFYKVDEAYDYLTGKIKPKRTYKKAKTSTQTKEEIRKEELEKRRAKAKKYAQMKYQKLKEEHEAFMSSPMLYLYLFAMLFISFILMVIVLLLIMVPILSKQAAIKHGIEFDTSTYTAWIIVLPLLYTIYRVFMEMVNLFKDQ